MKARIPGAAILVYDNYNALAIGFGPNEKAGQVILSLAVMPRWVTLCFVWGVRLSDPHKLLKGSGSRVRNVRLFASDALDDPRIEALIAEERKASHSYGGRSVFGWEPEPDGQAASGSE